MASEWSADLPHLLVEQASLPVDDARAPRSRHKSTTIGIVTHRENKFLPAPMRSYPNRSESIRIRVRRLSEFMLGVAPDEASSAARKGAGVTFIGQHLRHS